MAHPVHLLPVWAEVLQLNREDQGLVGALHQYWNIDEKPRLYRRNTYLTALRVGIVASVVATAIIGLWSLGGIL